jgi:hypothetical protein
LPSNDSRGFEAKPFQSSVGVPSAVELCHEGGVPPPAADVKTTERSSAVTLGQAGAMSVTRTRRPPSVVFQRPRRAGSVEMKTTVLPSEVVVGKNA